MADATRRQLTRHPWDRIYELYIHGEDVETPDKDGGMVISHKWPTQVNLSGRYGIRLDQVSRRFCKVGPDGKTANDRKAAYKSDYMCRVGAELLEVMVGLEIRVRLAAMAIAELGLQQIAHQLSRPQSADHLAKLMTAARRAQDVGLVALNRQAEEAKKKDVQVPIDWTLVRRSAFADK